MELKRYYAEDMSHGLRAVKAEMGADAVILGSNRVGDRIEIVAAINYDEGLYEELTGRRTRGKNLPVDRPAVPVVLNDLVNLELQQELVQLQSTLKSELAQLSDFRERKAVEVPKAVVVTPDPKNLVVKRLEALGLSKEVSKAIAKKFPRDSARDSTWQDIFNLLGTRLSVGDDEILTKGGIVAVVGSTGVGKTTTVAKLAAQYSDRHGKGKVALINTDTLRVGGQEQLATFGRSLGVPVAGAATSKELSLRIREYSKYDLVLIDTVGMSQRDISLAHHLQSISAGSTKIQPYLVISSTCDLRLTREVIKAFYKIPLKGAIVTKIDEAVSLGPVLSGVIRHKLPISYLCNGQDVPRDIAAANKNDLLRVIKQLMYLSHNNIRPTSLAAHQLQIGA